MARTYRKKPVVVEAVQWTGENHAEMCEFIDPEVFEIIPRVGLVIHTLEGDHHASPGDYIIKGVNGEFYPCKPDIFAKTYESATLTPPNEWVSVEERLPEVGQEVLVYWRNTSQKAEHFSYGKDSLACLGAIEQLGWPLDRIVHAEVWATDMISADLPPMVEFKAMDLKKYDVTEMEMLEGME